MPFPAYRLRGGGSGTTQAPVAATVPNTTGTATPGDAQTGAGAGAGTGTAAGTNPGTGANAGTASPGQPPAASPGAGTTARFNSVAVQVQASQSGDFNRPFVSVTVCTPGTADCRTIDRILVNTSSTGLILMASAIDPALSLPQLRDASGRATARCLLYGTSNSAGKYEAVSWSAVRKADLKLADMVAPSLSVEVMNDDAIPSIPDICRNAGISTLTDLGYNGMLGLRGLDADCGASCAAQVHAVPRYYGCDATGCAGVTVPVESQVRNPVALFGPGYDNGHALSLPALDAVSNTPLQGRLTFGIGAQAGNEPANVKMFRNDNAGYLTAFYNGVQTRAMLDTNYRSLKFHDPSIPQCSSSTVNSYYCPPSAQGIDLSLLSASGTRDALGLTIMRPPSSTPYQVASFGRYGAAEEPVVLGVPFYLGRTVFTAIEGKSTPLGIGPYIAF
jgi:hypothetical protein